MLSDRRSPVKGQKPSRDHWTNFALGRTGAYLSASTNVNENVLTVACVLASPAASDWFDRLQNRKTEIEAALGPVMWDRKEGRRSHYILIRKPDTDPADEADWPKQHAWLADKVEAFSTTFGPLVRDLPLPNNLPSEGPPA